MPADNIILNFGLWFWLASLVCGVAVTWAAISAPWGVFRRERGIQHLFFGAILALTLLWLLRAGISTGLSIHFLGMTTITLMFGWDLAICAGMLTLLATSFLGRDLWLALPINALCFVLIPVALSYSLYLWVSIRLPKNFFIYLLLCAFLGGALSIAVGTFCFASLLWLADIYSWEKIVDELIRYLPLTLFPEGFINGTLILGMMVYFPDWIRTFDPARYLDGQ